MGASQSVEVSSVSVFYEMLQRMRDQGLYRTMYVDTPNSVVYTMYFPSLAQDAPVMVFYPGGPGGSAISLMFTSFGPYLYNESSSTWTRNSGPRDVVSRYSMLYLDVPGDTGYSIAKEGAVYSDSSLIQDTTYVLKYLLSAYGLEKREITLMGFSYAGKLWPSVARQLLIEGYNVSALGLFSPYIDPIVQEVSNINEYLFELGTLTVSDYEALEELSHRIEKIVSNNPSEQDMVRAQELYLKLIETVWNETGLYTYNVTQNVFQSPQSDKIITVTEMLNTPSVRRVLGAQSTFNDSATSFNIDQWGGFLTNVNDALKFCTDAGVFTLIFVSSFDGALFASSTIELLESLYGSSDDELWMQRPIPLSEDEHQENWVYGKIMRYTPNVIGGTVYSAGHSMVDSENGAAAFDILMEYLYQKRVWNPIEQ